MVCVYCVSHVPALLMLEIPGYEQRTRSCCSSSSSWCSLSDVLQYVWGKPLGKHKIAPSISPNKTWAGFIGGVVCADADRAALWWATPFSRARRRSWHSCSPHGVCRRADDVRDQARPGRQGLRRAHRGHGGVLDRIDSLCFAAPVFFHLTRFFHTP